MLIENLASSGTAELFLRSFLNTTQFITDGTGLFKLKTTSSSIGYSTITALEVYPNGVLTAGRKANNKVFVVYDMAASDTPSSATNFYGLGVNHETFRYQVPTTSNTHTNFFVAQL